MNRAVFDVEDLRKNLSHFQLSEDIVEFTMLQLHNSHANNWISLNEHVKAIVLDRSSFQPKVFEVHREFYDLHATQVGEDIIYLAENAREYSTYNLEGDYQMLKGENLYFEHLLPNKAILIPPGIPHANDLKVGGRKMVLKINKCLWQK